MQDLLCFRLAIVVVFKLAGPSLVASHMVEETAALMHVVRQLLVLLPALLSEAAVALQKVFTHALGD